jgi:hypothetical protein
MDRETEYQYSGRLIEGLMNSVRAIAHCTIDNVLCAYCYMPKWMHARGRWAWCPVARNGVLAGEVFAALLCDYTGPESRDGLADGEMCMQAGTVVGIESGQCYCLKHWQKVRA